MSKRTLDAFFKPQSSSKRPRLEASSKPPSHHASYPFPIPQLPPAMLDGLGFAPEDEGRAINNQPDLDLLYFQPYIPKQIEKDLFQFLRSELPFYRVQYSIKRGGFETEINTPRYTTVFGVDATSFFSEEGALFDSKTKAPVPKDRYKCQPRPIPHCLDELRVITEGSTGETFNFCLVNYYASGNDSISYHSDDERFLGPNPAIASFSLGAARDFLMKHKPPPPSKSSQLEATQVGTKPLKFALASGDMILMRAATQANWLHSIPKRKGMDVDRGRINITFRKAMIPGGTANYYQYNVGSGAVFKWNEKTTAMETWQQKGEPK